MACMLIADDDAGIRETLHLRVDDGGYEVCALCSNGLAYLNSHDLTNTAMPGTLHATRGGGVAQHSLCSLVRKELSV
jgi:hypothetical protein